MSDVNRLLEAATTAVGRVRYCWLVTAIDGACRARPMGRLAREPGDDPWLLRFLTDGHSAKARELRAKPEVSVIFDDDAHEAYVALGGRAALIEDKAEIRGRWLRAYETFFPEGPDRSGAIFVTVEVERIDLWVRGVTSEPFGLKTTVLERDAAHCWRLLE